MKFKYEKIKKEFSGDESILTLGSEDKGEETFLWKLYDNLRHDSDYDFYNGITTFNNCFSINDGDVVIDGEKTKGLVLHYKSDRWRDESEDGY